MDLGEKAHCRSAAEVSASADHQSTVDTIYARLQDIGEQPNNLSANEDIDGETLVELNIVAVSAFRRDVMDSVRREEHRGSRDSQRGSPTKSRLLVRHTTSIIVGSMGTLIQSIRQSPEGRESAALTAAHRCDGMGTYPSSLGCCRRRRARFHRAFPQRAGPRRA